MSCLQHCIKKENEKKDALSYLFIFLGEKKKIIMMEH